MRRIHETAHELPTHVAARHSFREKYSKHYHVWRDEAGEPFIPCWKRTARFGMGDVRPHVYQWSVDGKILGYVGVGRVKKAALLGKFPGIFKVHIDGQREFILTFERDQLDRVASALHARRRRRLSERERKRLRKVGKVLQLRLKAKQKRGRAA